MRYRSTRRKDPLIRCGCGRPEYTAPAAQALTLAAIVDHRRIVPTLRRQPAVMTITGTRIGTFAACWRMAC